jgi:hypothetical protein
MSIKISPVVSLGLLFACCACSAQSSKRAQNTEEINLEKRAHVAQEFVRSGGKIDRDALLKLFERLPSASDTAQAQDESHRWASDLHRALLTGMASVMVYVALTHPGEQRLLITATVFFLHSLMIGR